MHRAVMGNVVQAGNKMNPASAAPKRRPPTISNRRSCPTVALRGIKTLANLSARYGISGADAQQVDTNNLMWASNDQKRGLAAFPATGRGSAVFEGN